MNADRKQGYFFQKIRVRQRLSEAAKVFQQTPNGLSQMDRWCIPVPCGATSGDAARLEACATFPHLLQKFLGGGFVAVGVGFLG
jgi:hypothetical protein